MAAPSPFKGGAAKEKTRRYSRHHARGSGGGQAVLPAREVLYLRACAIGHNVTHASGTPASRSALQLSGAFLHAQASAQIAGGFARSAGVAHAQVQSLESRTRPLAAHPAS